MSPFDTAPLPTTTRTFAQWLRDLAAEVDRIAPDTPLYLRDVDVEIGFYHGDPATPATPTGIHVTINGASTHREGT